MQTDVRSLKLFIDAQRREIAAAHRGGADGFATCGALTSLMDGVICSGCEALPPGTMDHIAILALGGYGRAELCPHSDIDVMVLCDSGQRREAAREAATTFLHFLWDAGVNVGHSVRTVDEGLSLYGTTFDSWASMLESRRVCGNETLSALFYDRVRTHLADQEPGWLIEAVLADVQNRHDRFGSSVKLLEPNIKKSAGGLRDLHAALWLHRGTDARHFVPITPGEGATRAFLGQLLLHGLVEPDEHDSAVRALEFLLRVRHEMHLLRDSLHDTLEYALQTEVAGGIGFGHGPRAVEVFMHEYYVHARAAHRLLQRVGQRFREAVDQGRPSGHRGERIGSAFILYDDALAVDASLAGFTDPKELFEACALAAEHDCAPDLRLRGLLERGADLLRPEDAASPELAAYFRRILRSRRVARTLYEMNDAGILPRYIPEFGDLVAFFQHNVYHYFTADEHTLIAIAKAEDLRDQPGILREVFRKLRRKDILYAALLLHDIAKPRGVSDHEITGVGMSRLILSRLGMEEAFPDVGFLVRNHLVMEQTAFRRNVNDPETLKEFAARFQRAEQLEYLYVLTYADLSALNTNVWTEWKAAMLQELYQRTAEILQRNLTGAQIDEYHHEKHEEEVETMIDALSGKLSREKVERHIRGMGDPSYLRLFSEEEVARHIAGGVGAQPVQALFSHVEGYTEITVIARDAPFALSKFCAVLSANDANIFDATIFTRDDGLIIDRFRVTDAASKQALDQQRSDKIASDLRQVVEGALDIEHLFSEHHKKWKRRPKPPANPLIRTDVEFEENPRYTIIDVYAPDSVGFLYRVTEVMSDLGLDIRLAKIATRLDGIVDAFYVLDRSGRRLVDPARQEGVRRRILETIQELADEGLGQTT